MKVFTTGQIAKICKVAPRTVGKWIDSGELKGYRIPGSQDRRVPGANLLRFMKEYGIPLGDLDDESVTKVLIVAMDSILVEDFKREFSPENACRVAVATSEFEVRAHAESFHPDCVVVDFSIGKTTAIQICHNLRKNSECATTTLIALLTGEERSLVFERGTFNEVFTKPFDPGLLAQRIRGLVDAKKELV